MAAWMDGHPSVTVREDGVGYLASCRETGRPVAYGAPRAVLAAVRLLTGYVPSSLEEDLRCAERLDRRLASAGR